LRVEPVPFLWAMDRGYQRVEVEIGEGAVKKAQARALPPTEIDSTITRVNS
jgi:hypothetical protein